MHFVLCSFVVFRKLSLHVQHIKVQSTKYKGYGLFLVGEDRIELSPRVPRTRMLALHHTPKACPKSQVQGPKSAVPFLTLDVGPEP